MHALSSSSKGALWPSPWSTTTRRSGRPLTQPPRALKDNFARLSQTTPPSSISKVIVRDSTGAEVATIPNADGKRASLVFFAHVSREHGGVLARGQGAKEAVALYDEVVAEAKGHRGSHPNIDLLLDVESGAIGALSVEVVEA